MTKKKAIHNINTLRAYLTPIIFIIILLVQSCGRNNEKIITHTSTSHYPVAYPYKINVSEAYDNPTNITLSSFADSIDYIPLETKPECLIKVIKDVEITSDYIFISQSNSIYKFDIEGKFLMQIGSHGNGPGEYAYIYSIRLNRNTKTIYVLDGMGKKVLKYDYNGKFLGSFKPGELFSAFLSIEPNLFVFHYPDVPIEHDIADYLLFFTDSLGNFQSKFVRKDNILAEQFVGIGQYNLYNIDNNVYFKDLHNDTILRVTPDTLTAHAVFEFGKYKLDKNVPTTTEMQKELEKYLLVINVIESPKNIFIKFSNGYGRKYFAGLYNKESGKLKISRDPSIKTTIFKNDLDGGPNFFPDNYDERLNRLIGFTTAFRLKKHLESTEFINKEVSRLILKEKLIKLKTRINENDNPIIILIKEKD
ncbi:MAG: 6-bladed beta-propeller [Bacteroidales bacterium]